MAYPRIDGADVSNSADALLDRPPPAGEARQVKLVKSDNIESLPEFDALPDCLEIPVLLALGDHVSTDEILPAGSRALPYRSNIPRISDFAFDQIDSDYPARARDVLDKDGQGHAIVAGRNYGQGSSREHAVIATRFLGLRVVLAKSIARIHHQNLANFGVLPLTVDSQEDFDRLSNAGHIAIDGIHQTLDKGQETISVGIDDGYDVDARIALDGRQRELVRAGGLINHAAAS